jgi:D-lyxose ketol-isomerase
MKRRDALKVAAIGSFGLVAGASCSFVSGDKKTESKKAEMKKYTNEYFYDNGVLNPEKALNAYKEMLAFYNVPYDEFLDKNMFISDFGLGDFANAGMAGVFWHNDKEFAYFAHEIFLLPGQMIVEHRHMENENPAKMETWHVRGGSIFNFGEGETTANNPKTPESQKDFITVSNVVELKLNGLQTLGRVEAPHFMMAGDQGAVVSEYANYHDGSALRFTNPDVAFTDILGNV